ncbi:hypothetical protein CF326_g9359 [Tilletia indica]|nr:hypothetical protein CF326_g9359 [Tilletia indica]
MAVASQAAHAEHCVESIPVSGPNGFRSNFGASRWDTQLLLGGIVRQFLVGAIPREVFPMGTDASSKFERCPAARKRKPRQLFTALGRAARPQRFNLPFAAQ